MKIERETEIERDKEVTEGPPDLLRDQNGTVIYPYYSGINPLIPTGIYI